jgi:ribonuclease HII
VEALLKTRAKASRIPKFKEEILCHEQGFALVAGIDEVGRGCLAGPVVASAVILNGKTRGTWTRKVRDSKLLTPEQREYLCPFIHEAAVSIGTGVVAPEVIDRRGMTQAVHLAMQMAIEKLLPQPDFILIDYLTLPGLPLPQKGVEDGDTLCFSIACASIVAKVYRDHLMVELDRRFPGYGFAQHKGYGTAEHLTCLKKLGPSPIHRWLFSPVKNAAQLSFEDIQKAAAGFESDET